jgi:glycosyltransferase involved in cell wall biosynthesis
MKWVVGQARLLVPICSTLKKGSAGMPRIGANPYRGKTTDYRPARVTVAVLTCVPEFTGYFQYRLEVVQLCIESILANTTAPFDLLIFDNGSCPEFVDYLEVLHDAGKVDYLILSQRNIGKVNALRQIFQLAPGGLVAYTDDDNFFLPGWLDAHLQIVDAFPNVGMVTGFYVRHRAADAVTSSLAFASRPDVTVEQGDFVLPEWRDEFISNTNRTQESYAKESQGLSDTIISYQGTAAFISAHHFQFVAPRHIILEVLPEWSEQLMGQMVEMDRAVDGLGYLRLTTRERTLHLMSNLASGEIRKMAAEMNIVVTRADARRLSPVAGKLFGNRLLKPLIKRIHNWTFQLLTRSHQHKI